LLAKRNWKGKVEEEFERKELEREQKIVESNVMPLVPEPLRQYAVLRPCRLTDGQVSVDVQVPDLCPFSAVFSKNFLTSSPAYNFRGAFVRFPTNVNGKLYWQEFNKGFDWEDAVYHASIWYKEAGLCAASNGSPSTM